MLTNTHCPVCEMHGSPVYPLPIICSIQTELRQLVKQAENWQFYEEWQHVIQIPEELICREPFFKWLMAREPFQAGLIKMLPRETYGWHTDSDRGVSINMLLDHESSIVAFSTKLTGIMKPIHPHTYEMGRFYVFNTQVPHMILNTGMADRILFTLEFARDVTKLKFDQLVKDIEENYVF